MKSIILLIIFLMNYLEASDSILQFLDGLNKSYEKNKSEVILNYEAQNMQNNIRYLVIPNMQKYVLQYMNFFNDTQSIDVDLKSILQPYSKFDIFLHGINLFMYDLKSKTVLNNKELSLLHTLQASQLYVLQNIMLKAENLDQLEFASKHLETFLMFAFDDQDTISCEILNNYRGDPSVFRFLVLAKTEYESANKDVNISLAFKNTIIKEKDRNIETYRELERKTLKIFNKRNDAFLEKLKVEYDEYLFIDEYEKQLNSEEKRLKQLEQEYSLKQLPLEELEQLYSQIYANMLMQGSFNVFLRILKTHEVYKKVQNSCKKR